MSDASASVPSPQDSPQNPAGSTKPSETEPTSTGGMPPRRKRKWFTQFPKPPTKDEQKAQAVSPDVRINGKAPGDPGYLSTLRGAPWRPKNSMPIDQVKAAQLDKLTGVRPVMPIKPFSPKMLRCVETLGLPKKSWERRKLQAVREFASFMTMEFTAQMAMVWNVESLDQADYAIQKLRERMEAAAVDPKVDAYDFSCLANAMAAMLKAHKDKTTQLIQLAEKANAKAVVDKPKNLPPTLALQVNVAGQQNLPPGTSPVQITQQQAPQEMPEDGPDEN